MTKWKHRLGLLALLGCGSAIVACATEPVVTVGRAHQPAAGSSGQRAGSGNDDDSRETEDHECTEVEPVCGSNGMTYQNQCQATMAGVSVARRGAC